MSTNQSTIARKWSNGRAFTLAEVLITLGIIGIVAAMTIPILIKNTQDAEFKAALKKDYSILLQAQKQIALNNGGDFSFAIAGCTTAIHNCLKNAFKSELSIVAECDTGNMSNCLSSPDVKYLNNDDPTGSTITAYYAGAGLVLKDGTTLAFFLDKADCTNTFYTPYTNNCGWMYVDVNGLKPPNQWGKDFYSFLIFADTIRPSFYTSGYNDCKSGEKGRTCAKKYLLGN